MKIYDVLLKNGTLIDPGNKINNKSDIAISSTKIAKVSKSIDVGFKEKFKALNYTALLFIITIIFLYVFKGYLSFSGISDSYIDERVRIDAILEWIKSMDDWIFFNLSPIFEPKER